MPEQPLNVLAVVGSLNKVSSVRFVVNHVANGVKAAGANVDLLDLLNEPLHSSTRSYTRASPASRNSKRASIGPMYSFSARRTITAA
jgi:hypothetical protein